jgi:hypothetical protein
LCEQLGHELLGMLANPKTAADFIEFQRQRLEADGTLAGQTANNPTSADGSNPTNPAVHSAGSAE